MTEIRLPSNWEPRDYQLPAWKYLQTRILRQKPARACLIWHRRSGKDDLALNLAAIAAWSRPAEYWHMLPEAAQARKVIWEATSPHTGKRRIDQAFPQELRTKTRDDDMTIRWRNGSLWRLVGSDNYESLLGSTPAGVVFSEWALADPKAWSFLRPILLENKGWAIFITTPRGPNHAKTTFDMATSDPDWFGQVLTVDDTKIFSPEALEKERQEYIKEHGPEDGQALFDQEYYCSFDAALVGSYYGAYLTRAQKEGRIGPIPIDRSVLVHTGWDLGIGDSTAIWFIQRAGREYRLIDYHEASGVGLDEYARILNEKRERYRWVYGNHCFPHDMAQRELSSGKSRADTMRALGFTPTIVDQHSNGDGVNAVRKLLDQAWIDPERCERGLNSLRNFRREWNDRLKMFGDKYLHDWASHGAKALETFACGYIDPRARRQPEFRPRLDIDEARQGTGWMAS